jgi:hypothetical protein
LNQKRPDLPAGCRFQRSCFDAGIEIELKPAPGNANVAEREDTMRYFLMTIPSEDDTPPSPEMMAKMAQFIEDQTRAGVLIATGGLLPVSQGGARVRSRGGKFMVTDGPFTEAKELIAGFALVEVSSREEALEASRKFYETVGDGEGEIRAVMGP